MIHDLTKVNCETCAQVKELERIASYGPSVSTYNALLAVRDQLRDGPHLLGNTSPPEPVIEVGDRIRTTTDLMGVVRFIYEEDGKMAGMLQYDRGGYGHHTFTGATILNKGPL